MVAAPRGTYEARGGTVRVLITVVVAGLSERGRGWIRPALLLPAATLAGLTPQQLEAVLAHELAHILRYDYVVNMLQTVVETLLFYHPAVWWASGRMRQERELCCDDLAVSACGDALCYARALTRLERLRVGAPAHAGLALGSTGGSLLYRIRRIMGEVSGAGLHAVEVAGHSGAVVGTRLPGGEFAVGARPTAGCNRRRAGHGEQPVRRSGRTGGFAVAQPSCTAIRSRIRRRRWRRACKARWWWRRHWTPREW